ncbi:GntR family transcriptional regulator [Saccharospirillum sp.]|uniref:GntR family transcriptional regulator n=1 Tax=Saccharospirillum sp. TaxID=2033801 RepID=UPI0034A09998
MQQETAGESAYRSIRSDIIGGRLTPCSRLRLDTLKERYSASVSTLRETLYRLSAEGLVYSEGQRGFEVAAVTQEEFIQLAVLRELLEGYALRESFRKGDLEWEGLVVGAYHKLESMERLMMTGDTRRSAEWKYYDREFHRTLVSACGSQELLNAYSMIFDRYQRYQIVAVIFRGKPAAQEHRVLLESALQRDAERALTVLHEHIDACVAHTVSIGQLPMAKRVATPYIGTASSQASAASSVGETVWGKLRADIITGKLAPGNKLKISSLRDLYQTSVATLREVLNRLTSEGFVIAEGQRGFEVAPVSAINIRELAELRLLVEGKALEDSFGLGDVDWEARVVAAYHKLTSAEADMEKGNNQVTERWKQCDWQFHQALISACGSQSLMHLHNAIFDKYLRYQFIALSYRGPIAGDEHHELFDCAMNRDVQGARKTLHEHLWGGVEHALAAGSIPG